MLLPVGREPGPLITSDYDANRVFHKLYENTNIGIFIFTV